MTTTTDTPTPPPASAPEGTPVEPKLWDIHLHSGDTLVRRLSKACQKAEADLAAARERIRKWEDDYTVLSDECHAARELRAALERIETHRPGSDESIIARAALAATKEES